MYGSQCTIDMNETVARVVAVNRSKTSFVSDRWNTIVTDRPIIPNSSTSILGWSEVTWQFSWLTMIRTDVPARSWFQATWYDDIGSDKSPTPGIPHSHVFNYLPRAVLQILNCPPSKFNVSRDKIVGHLSRLIKGAAILDSSRSIGRNKSKQQQKRRFIQLFIRSRSVFISKPLPGKFIPIKAEIQDMYCVNFWFGGRWLPAGSTNIPSRIP